MPKRPASPTLNLSGKFSIDLQPEKRTCTEVHKFDMKAEFKFFVTAPLARKRRASTGTDHMDEPVSKRRFVEDPTMVPDPADEDTKATVKAEIEVSATIPTACKRKASADMEALCELVSKCRFAECDDECSDSDKYIQADLKANVEVSAAFSMAADRASPPNSGTETEQVTAETKLPSPSADVAHGNKEPVKVSPNGEQPRRQNSNAPECTKTAPLRSILKPKNRKTVRFADTSISATKANHPVAATGRTNTDVDECNILDGLEKLFMDDRAAEVVADEVHSRESRLYQSYVESETEPAFGTPSIVEPLTAGRAEDATTEYASPNATKTTLIKAPADLTATSNSDSS